MGGLVTIIIPVYKAERYLSDCLDSIINQSYSNLEIVLVDDGSPDHSPEICDEYALKDPRVRVLHQTNSGVSIARNKGIEEANGEFIMFVDADDWLDTDYVATLVNYSCGFDLVVSSFREEVERSNHQRKYKKILSDEEINTQERILTDCVNSQIYTYTIWGKLYKKNLVDSIRFKQFSYSEDAMFCREVLAKCSSIKLLKNEGYHYRINEVSVTASTNREEERISGALNMLYLTKKLWVDIDDDVSHDSLQKLILKNAKNYIRIALKRHNICSKESVMKNLTMIRKNCQKQLSISDNIIILLNRIIYN